MNYQRSITILSDGKTVTAINNKTGMQATGCCSSDENFILVYKAAIAIERLIEKQDLNTDEIEAGDRVSFSNNFDTQYIYPYDDSFVYNLPIEDSAKTRYCYSVSHPPINTEYFVLAIKGNKAYIQTVGGRFRCYVVSTKIIEKVIQ